MKIDVRERQAGKTKDLIVQSALGGAVIIVPDEKQRRYVLDMAMDLKLEIPAPVTFADFVVGKMAGQRPTAILIDNLDQIFPHFFLGYKIEAVTMTKTD